MPMAFQNSKTATPPINTTFIKMGESPQICREHVHTGRPHTSIIEDNSTF